MSHNDLSDYLDEVLPTLKDEDFDQILTKEIMIDDAREVSTEDRATAFKDKIIDTLFKEILQNSKRNYIDFDEFSKILWSTPIDRTCVIHLI